MAVEWFSHASQGDSNVKIFFLSFLSLHRSQCNGISMLIYTVKVHNLIQQISTTIAFQRTIMSCKSLTLAKIVGYASCICSMSHTIGVSPHTTESPTFLGSIPAKATSSEKLCGADTRDTLYIFCSDTH